MKFLVVNAQHMKAVPDLKIDIMDAKRIAQLLRRGCLKASFIPDRNQQELRVSLFHIAEVLLKNEIVIIKLKRCLTKSQIRLCRG